MTLSTSVQRAQDTQILLALSDPLEHGRLKTVLRCYGYRVQSLGLASHDSPADGGDEQPARFAVLVRDGWGDTSSPLLNGGLRGPRLNTAVICLVGERAAERAAALEAGADDALSRPFEARELIARVESVRRRWLRNGATAATPTELLTFGSWRLDPATKSLQHASGQRITLANAELKLLRVFLARPQHVLARDDLMDLARGRGAEAFERSIDLLVSRLRHKLQDDPAQPCHIHTIRGVGYLFNRVAV